MTDRLCLSLKFNKHGFVLCSQSKELCEIETLSGDLTLGKKILPFSRLMNMLPINNTNGAPPEKRYRKII